MFMKKQLARPLWLLLVLACFSASGAVAGEALSARLCCSETAYTQDVVSE
jgi:hypothetical protein